MQGILGEGQTDVEYEIYDGFELSAENLLYDSNNIRRQDDPKQPRIEQETILLLQGRTWTLSFTTGSDHLTGPEKHQPTAIAIAGLIVDLLLFYVITALAYLHKRATGMAEEMTHEIREARDKLALQVKASEKLVDVLTATNEELEQFNMAASHDLQEPLRKIQAFGNRLSSKYSPVLDERGQDYLQRMQNAAARMQTLIEAVRRLSGIGREEQALLPVDLNTVLHEVVADLDVRIEQHGGRVELDALPTIEADPVQMRQLFQNLISNALKFHREGVAPVVKVHATTLHTGGEGEAGPGWIINVEDNGIGFDEHYLDRIFKPFQRLHGREAYEGTGIGLAICHKIITRHGGALTATSTPGTGTTFTITLHASSKQRQTQRTPYASPSRSRPLTPTIS